MLTYIHIDMFLCLKAFSRDWPNDPLWSCFTDIPLTAGRCYWPHGSESLSSWCPSKIWALVAANRWPEVKGLAPLGPRDLKIAGWLMFIPQNMGQYKAIEYGDNKTYVLSIPIWIVMWIIGFWIVLTPIWRDNCWRCVTWSPIGVKLR